MKIYPGKHAHGMSLQRLPLPPRASQSQCLVTRSSLAWQRLISARFLVFPWCISSCVRVGPRTTLDPCIGRERVVIAVRLEDADSSRNLSIGPLSSAESASCSREQRRKRAGQGLSGTLGRQDGGP